ncbi:MAG: hypothetical protein JZD41_02160 [Thermoproteus sp.]|nr:hypothetical protein [Thermoproteus sp.]
MKLLATSLILIVIGAGIFAVAIIVNSSMPTILPVGVPWCHDKSLFLYSTSLALFLIAIVLTLIDLILTMRLCGGS